jgi:hypothetical protein
LILRVICADAGFACADSGDFNAMESAIERSRKAKGSGT